jgi:hypothetical protein
VRGRARRKCGELPCRASDRRGVWRGMEQENGEVEGKRCARGRPRGSRRSAWPVVRRPALKRRDRTRERSGGMCGREAGRLDRPESRRIRRHAARPAARERDGHERGQKQSQRRRSRLAHPAKLCRRASDRYPYSSSGLPNISWMNPRSSGIAIRCTWAFVLGVATFESSPISAGSGLKPRFR